MKRCLLSSRGNIIEVFVENDKKIQVNVYSLNFSERKLRENSSFSCCCKVKVELLAVKDVLETSTSQRIPVALVEFADPTFGTHSLPSFHVLYINIKEQKCQILRKFVMDSPEQADCNLHGKSSAELILLDGPSVFLPLDAKFLLYSSKKGLNLTRNLCLVGHSCGECNKVTQTKLFHSIFKYPRTILFIGVSFSNHCDSCSLKLDQYLEVIVFQDEIVKLDPKLFIPEEYHETINSIFVVDTEIRNLTVLTSKVYAATKNGYILSIQNGQLKSCMSLNNPSKQFISEYQEDILVCCIPSEDKQYVMVKKEQDFMYLDDSLKVQREYQNIQHMLHRDFIGNGTVQALFLKATDLSTCAWILDDFNQLCIQSGDPVVEKEDEVKSAHIATKALQSRLQQEQSFLEEQEQILLMKKEFLTKRLTQQLGTAAGSCLKHTEQKVDLVTLLEGKDIDTGVEPFTERTTQPVVEMCCVWQKTYNNRWCIAVEFYWTSERSAEVWLQVTPSCGNNSQLFTESKSVICQSESSLKHNGRSVPCPPNRTKLQKTDLPASVKLETDPVLYTATCVTDVPQFIQKSVKVCLALKWRYFELPMTTSLAELKDDNLEGKIVSNYFDSRVFTQSCGEVILDSADVVAGKFEITFHSNNDSLDVFMEEYTDIKRCRLAWKLTQTCTELNIKSSLGILSKLDHLLMERCSFVYSSHYQCYFTSITSLSHLQLELSPSTADASREMRVYTKSTQDLFLLLHHLYRCLPDNIVILPINDSRTQLQRILSIIQQEFYFLSDGMKKLTDSLRRTSADTEREGSTYQSDDVAEVREGFKRKREEFMTKENMAVDLSDMKDFLAQLSLYQQDTDSTIAGGGV